METDYTQRKIKKILDFFFVPLDGLTNAEHKLFEIVPISHLCIIVCLILVATDTV